MRAAGRIVSVVLAELGRAAQPGVSTLDLDRLAFEIIKDHGGSPSFLGHRHGSAVYEHSICASVNREVVHGIPRADRILENGDILSIDVGVKLKGFHGDSAVTVPIGEISQTARDLLRVTHESLWHGIRAIRKNGRIQDISRAVQRHVESRGYSVVRSLCGHGIGRDIWEAPEVPNYVEAGRGNIAFHEGLVIAIEPMINTGGYDVRVLPDKWTIVTEDGGLSAHFEHTVAITPNGYEVLTLGPHEPTDPGV